MKRIFSGIQPSGIIHLGNYLGAIRNWVEMQNNFESVFCIVDLHAITVKQDPKELRENILKLAKLYIACGIDPKKNTIFVQSEVKEHCELAWILNTIAKMGELSRMTQFKDKSAGSGRENAAVGLFDYPVLMAADILLYDTEAVPVGEDQAQHVELARVLARRFNQQFGESFTVPEPMVRKEGKRIMGLDDPKKKMSKSASSPMNYIALLDAPDVIMKKIRRAVTDSGSEIRYSGNKPAIKNLLEIFHMATGRSLKDLESAYKGKGYGEFKADLAEAVVSFLAPIKDRYDNMNDKLVRKMLDDGAKKARKMAEKKMEHVKKVMGLGI